MADKPHAADTKATTPGADAAAPVMKRAPGHRHADVRDTVAEMAARAQEISQEAGSKVAQAMKDVINAAAGLAGFAVESARDLVQYMVRRGQMTQEEADKLIREAEEAHARRKPSGVRADASAAAGAPAAKKAPPARKAPASAPAPRKSVPGVKKSAPVRAAKAGGGGGGGGGGGAAAKKKTAPARAKGGAKKR